VSYTLIGTRTERSDGGWQQTVVAGDRQYLVGVHPYKRVRIPYKPRGHNMGWQHLGFVRSTDEGARFDWSEKVPGSLGVQGLLTDAGVITTADHRVGCKCQHCERARWNAAVAARSKPSCT
jgi:hypothetical protein